MKTRLLITTIILVLSLAIPQASACSCAAEWNIEDDFDENDIIIFSGKVTNIKQQLFHNLQLHLLF